MTPFGLRKSTFSWTTWLCVTGLQDSYPGTTLKGFEPVTFGSVFYVKLEKDSKLEATWHFRPTYWNTSYSSAKVQVRILTCLCVNVLAGFFARDCYKGIWTCYLAFGSMFWLETTDKQEFMALRNFWANLYCLIFGSSVGRALVYQPSAQLHFVV